MPPRKSAAAARKVDGPTLTLIVEKGPLSGQIKDFRPGSMVHIGRLVRGNTLSIKDVGVSSKHLVIQFDSASDPDSRRWTITDLASSNGTILNGELLDPSEPAALSDGDVVKIGEETSIKVKIEVRGAENEIEPSSDNVRRNARRRVREHVGDLVVIKEDAELGLRDNEKETEKVDAIEAKQRRNVNTRETRNSAKIENLVNDMKVEEDRDLAPSEIRGSRGVSTRRTRNVMKEKDIEVDLGPIENRESRVSTRRTRNARKNEKVDDIAVDIIAIEDNKIRRGGRGRKNQPVETISEETEKEEPILNHETCEEDNKMRRGGRGRKKQPISEETEKEEPILNHETCEEEKERSEVRVDEAGTEVKGSGTEGVVAGSTSSSGGVKESKVKMVPDLKNMNLGEWLDFWYVQQRQEIIDQTEEMLAEMRRKAERCHEFRLQQKNTKAAE